MIIWAKATFFIEQLFSGRGQNMVRIKKRVFLGVLKFQHTGPMGPHAGCTKKSCETLKTKILFYIVIWAWEFGKLKIPVRWACRILDRVPIWLWKSLPAASGLGNQTGRKQTWPYHVQNGPSCARHLEWMNEVLQTNIQERLGKWLFLINPLQICILDNYLQIFTLALFCPILQIIISFFGL